MYPDGRKEVIFRSLEPYETPEAIEKICEEYDKIIHKLNVDPLVAVQVFIHDFLCIHPFNDGNDRVGRLVALKECLHHNIVPFITENSKKSFYYRALSKWKDEKDWLIDTCLDGQDTFIKLLDMLEIPHF